MTKVLDPTKDARKEARKQEELLKQQKQEQTLAQAEAADDVARGGAKSQQPNKYGKRSLIAGVQKRTELG